MKRIGNGTFTTAYLKDARTVLLKSEDPIKECMANGWFPSCRLFPKVKYAGLENTKEGFAWYEMKYMAPSRSLKRELDPDQWALYKAIRWSWLNVGWGTKSGFDWTYKMLANLKKHYPQYKRQHRQLLEAWEATMNYGSDIAFEISPRNVRAVNGKLVLLDCFFKLSTLKEVKKRKSKQWL